MALLFLRLFVAQLSLKFFVEELPEELKTDLVTEFLTRK